MLFSILFIVVSGIGIIRAAGHFSIFGFAISEKVSSFPQASIIYLVLIFVIAIIALFVASSNRKIVY